MSAVSSLSNMPTDLKTSILNESCLIDLTLNHFS